MDSFAWEYLDSRNDGKPDVSGTLAVLEQKLNYARQKHDTAKTLFEKETFLEWIKRIVSAIQTIEAVSDWPANDH